MIGGHWHVNGSTVIIVFGEDFFNLVHSKYIFPQLVYTHTHTHTRSVSQPGHGFMTRERTPNYWCLRQRGIITELMLMETEDLNLGPPNPGRMLLPLIYRSSGI